MNQHEKVSLGEFSRKLRKYCANGVACATQEKQIVSRLEAIINQRDVCLTHLAKEKERELILCEEIEDLQHQHEEALELFNTIEKKCAKLALELPSVDAGKHCTNAVTLSEAKDNVDERVDVLDEPVFRRMLRKYCNLYVQFNQRSNAVRVLSLHDHSFFEISLDESESNELRTKTWSSIGSSSIHLSSWENLL